MKFEIIRIEWEKQVHGVEDAHALEKKLDLNKHNNILYQVYGRSPIYGENALLYIGITTDSNRRINQHLKAKFSRGLGLNFRIGQIQNPELLEIAESILINYHKPSYNAEYLNDIYGKAKNQFYMVLNQGNRGVLDLECSNIWWKEIIESGTEPLENKNA